MLSLSMCMDIFNLDTITSHLSLYPTDINVKTNNMDVLSCNLIISPFFLQYWMYFLTLQCCSAYIVRVYFQLVMYHNVIKIVSFLSEGGELTAT